MEMNIQQHQEYNKTLIMMAREQLMEDIDAICDEFFCEHFPNSQEQFDDLVRVLCDAVCRNFPSNWCILIMPSKEQLIDALYQEYVFLCHDDFDPDEDPTPEEYLEMLKEMSYDELIVETSTDDIYHLGEFMKTWGWLWINLLKKKLEKTP